jgi:salicylate hydroxylase
MKKIVIIGAGISGLFFANLLRQNLDYDITIYEKNNSIKLEKGYGIQLSVNSIKLLNKIGFNNLNPKIKFNPIKLDFYSLKNKKKICDLNISEFNTKDEKYTTLQRSVLTEFLKEKIPNNVIQYNKKIKQIDTKKEIIKLTMEDNSIVECNYLIVADGVFSSTKSLVAKKNIKLKYSNLIAVRGTIDKKNIRDIDYKNISLLLGSDLHSVIYPVDKSDEFNFITILKKNFTKGELENYTLFEDNNFLSLIIKEILIQVDQNIVNNIKNIKCFPVFTSNKICNYKHKKIFIIGDALFAFPPAFAQGATQSIEASYDLFKMFENNGSQFLKKRSKRIKMINRRSRFNNFAFHLSNPLIIFIRDILMKYLVKNKRFLYGYLGKIYNNE